jgi:uncharacterized protein YndB with AHSA1/START domain
MRWLKRAVLAVVMLVVVLAAIGFMLPSNFKVQRAATIAAPPEKVYAFIADPRQWKAWSAWNRRDPAMQVQYAGAASGTGAKWSWQSQSQGNGAMEFIEAVPGERVVYSLTFPDMGMTSRGTLSLAPEGGGTRITWSQEGDVGRSPVNRYFALFMDRLVGPDFEQGLANLKALAEKS